MAFVHLLVVCAGLMVASTSALPAIPSGYTMLMNVTVEMSDAQQYNVLETAYQGYNSSLTVAYAPGGEPYQLSDGNDQTKLSYNPATKTCTASCFGGRVCSSGSCSVYSGGIFGPLPATKPNGECTYKVNGATRYTVSIPNGSGANTLDLEYCFIGNQPIYILEKVVAPQQASYHTKIADYASRRLSQASGSATPVAVVMLVLEFKPLNPDPSTFDVPAFCGCSSL